MAEHVWRVGGLFRYPVKSFQGGAEQELTLGAEGVVGDRAFGVLDGTRRTVLSAKRIGRLLELSATYDDAGDLVVALPGGHFTRGPALDAALSAFVERDCRLVEAAAFGAGRYESAIDPDDEDGEVDEWEGPTGSFVDESPLHLLSTASLRAAAREQPTLTWSPRRFRPNILIETDEDGFLDEELVGRRLRIGEVEVAVTKRCTRCVMTTRSQPGGLTREPGVLSHLARAHNTTIGVRARVVVAGRVRVGDEVLARD